MVSKRRIALWGGRFLFALVLLPALGLTQTEKIRIDITAINRVVHKNWLSIPRSADYTVYWDAYQTTPSGWTAMDIKSFSRFHVLCKSRKDEQALDIQGNYATFRNCRVGERYEFTVEGMRNGNTLALSDTAWAVTGKPVKGQQQGDDGRLASQGPSTKTKWHYYLPINGRIPLAFLGQGKIFDMSSFLGKICFHLIWILFLGGIFIWLYYCMPNLSLARVFPMSNKKIIGRGYDTVYKGRELPEFRKILEDWRSIMMRANQNVRQELGHGEKIDIQDISEANVKFWRDEGTKAVHDLVKRITDSGLERYPTVRVIKAGLEHHEVGGFRWLEVTKDVERAIENQASSEIEMLKRKTMFDQLWNIATIEPLLGLFGTVTGISASFGVLSALPEDVTQIALINKLSGGIYEALWTTIEGLFVGIIFSLLYYFYQKKLDWVYSKWEEIYVYVAEKL